MGDMEGNKGHGLRSRTYPSDAQPAARRRKAKAAPGDAVEDFLKFLETQFVAVLYCMVVFLVFFMFIFSSVMRMMTEKERHLRFFKSMQGYSMLACILVVLAPFAVPYAMVLLRELRGNRNSRVAFSIAAKRAKLAIKYLSRLVENSVRKFQGLPPKELPARYKLVV